MKKENQQKTINQKAATEVINCIVKWHSLCSPSSIEFLPSPSPKMIIAKAIAEGRSFRVEISEASDEISLYELDATYSLSNIKTMITQIKHSLPHGEL